MLGIETCLWHLQALLFWESYLNFLSLSLLSVKMSMLQSTHEIYVQKTSVVSITAGSPDFQSAFTFSQLSSLDPYLWSHPGPWFLRSELIFTKLPIVGEGNGTPLQYSCLENPVDGGAWWAAVHGVTKSRTRLSDFPFTFHFYALEGGNGNPFQFSCLENPRDGGAWWAAIYGVAQSWTQLKQLSSSSSSIHAAL